MADRPPRQSTDNERAPLLSESAAPEGERAASNPARPYDKEPAATLTKVLLPLVIALLLVSSVFIGLFAATQHKLNSRKQEPTLTQTITTTPTRTLTSIPAPTGRPDEVCLTPECIRLSASILASIDTSVDPCESFYDFITNGWRKDHPLSADQGRRSIGSELDKKNRAVVKAILESNDVPLGSLYDTQVLGKLRRLYASCIDEKKLDELGSEPLVRFTTALRKLFDGKHNTPAHAGLTEALSLLHSRGVDTLFNVNVEGDVGIDPDDMILWISQPEFGLPSKEYYKEDAVMSDYTIVVKRLLVHLDGVEQGLHVESAATFKDQTQDNTWSYLPRPSRDEDDKDDYADTDFDALAKAVVHFEKRLVISALDLETLYLDPIATYNPMPLQNFTRKFPQLDFPAYFAAFAPRNFPARVVVTSPAYITALSTIVDETSAEVLEAYLVARAALVLAPLLSPSTEAWRAQRSLEETLEGLPQGAVGERSEFCVDRVESAMGFAVGRYFANLTFGEDSKTEVTRITHNVIEEMKRSLADLEWMGQESAAAAVEKADAVNIMVGYPTSPNTTDAGSIAAYYRFVRVHNDTFFENVLQASASDVQRKWQRLGTRRDHNEWRMWPSEAQAYYSFPSNDIVITAGTIQTPWFAPEWPRYITYGSMGYTAAHELTHGFDSTGRLYNEHSKLEEWWSKSTGAAYRSRQNCLAQQYSHYYVKDAHGNKVYVNGNFTSAENIGDSGLIHAYRAWKAQYADSHQAGSEFALPGLSYSREQLFFIAFGRTWAKNVNPEAEVAQVRSNPHSPGRFRVDGALYTIPEFAEAFNCPATAKLNPPMEKRCMFW